MGMSQPPEDKDAAIFPRRFGGLRAMIHRPVSGSYVRRAGVSEGEIMKLCGWRTRSMFDRYQHHRRGRPGRGGGEAVW